MVFQILIDGILVFLGSVVLLFVISLLQHLSYLT